MLDSDVIEVLDVCRDQVETMLVNDGRAYVKMSREEGRMPHTRVAEKLLGLSDPTYKEESLNKLRQN